MSSLICRTAQPSDIKNILLLEEACFNKFTHEAESVYAERIECFPQGFMILEHSTDPNRERGGSPLANKNEFIGAVSSEIWTYNPDIAPDHFSLGHSVKQQINLSGEELYISSIAVHPHFQSRGYGKKLFFSLIHNVVTNYRNVTRGILLVNENWTATERLYEKNGFYEVTKIKDFFTEDDKSKSDGIIMRHDNIKLIISN